MSRISNAALIDRVGAAWGFTSAERESAVRRAALQGDLERAKVRLNELATRVIEGDTQAAEEAVHVQRDIARIRNELQHEHDTRITDAHAQALNNERRARR